MKIIGLMGGCSGTQMPMLVCALTACMMLGAQDTPPLPAIDATRFVAGTRAQIERAERDARANPRDAGASGALAMTLYAYDQYGTAAQTYSRALALEPGNFDWAYLLGAVKAQLGDFEGAAKALEAALRLRPGDLPAQLRLGQSLIAMARWDEAETLYRRALATHSGSPQVLYGLGRVQAGRGDHDAAAQSYARACELFPAYGAAHFALAGELRRLGRRAEADQQAAAYAKFSDVEPPLPDPLLRRVRELNQGVQVHLQRGTDLEKQGRLAEAIREHEAALAIDSANVQVHVNLISLYGRTGNAAKAQEHFETATRLNPGRPDAWYNYGVLEFGRKNYADAEPAFARALAINPYYAEAHNNLGAVYELQGRFDDAAREFRDAIANRPDYPLARFHLARILVHQGRYDDAIQQLLKALTPENEQTPVYMYALGAAYARAGNRDNALRYYGKARAAALARGQSQLLASIDRDLERLSGNR